MIREAIAEKGIFTLNEPETREHKVRIHNAITSKMVSCSEIDGAEIEVVDIIATPHKYDEGEGYKIALFTKDGKTYSASGNAVITSLEHAISIFGKPTVDDPLKFKVQMTKSGKNSMYKYVMLVSVA